jgi:hypothetical protein
MIVGVLAHWMPLPGFAVSRAAQLMHPPDSVSCWHAAYSVAQLLIMQGSQPISLFGSPLAHVIMQAPGTGVPPELLPLLEPLPDPLSEPASVPLLEPELPPLLEPELDPELLPLLDPLLDPELLPLPDPEPSPEPPLDEELQPASAITSPTASVLASPHSVA